MSRRMPVARFDEGVYAINSILGWNGHAMPVWVTAERQRFWHRCGARHAGLRLARTLRWHDERAETEIHLGIPHRSREAGGVHEATALWTVVEGSDQVQRAARFRPLPSMVLRGGGSRRWLIWALEEPLSYLPLVDANRKLAYHLRARQKDGDPDLVWFPVPGTCLRDGRSRPVPVVVSRLSPVTFAPGQIVGRLREPPPKDAWMAGAAR